MSFYDDLARGKRGEKFILSVIQEKYPEASIVDEWSHDIYIPEVNMTVEVKTDYISKQTPNIGFEIAYDDEPSGILKEFNFWAHIFYDYGWKYFIAEGSIVRGLAYTGREITGGDGNLSTMLLVPKWSVNRADNIKVIPVGKKKKEVSQTEGD